MSSIKRVLICIITPDFNLLDRFSAVASVVYSMAVVLRDSGYEVYVNDKALERWEHDTIITSTVYMPITKFSLIRFFPMRLREFVKDVLFFKKNSSLKKNIEIVPKPDLVISWITIGNSYSVDLMQKWKVPLVSIFDNPLVEEYTYLKGFPPFFKRIVNKNEGRVIRNSKAIIAYSHAVKEYIQKIHKTNSVFYFKAFTDFKRMNYLNYDRDLSEIRFVYIGSFFNWHKIDDLIEAFVNVNRLYANCRLYLVGDGPEYERIKGSVNHGKIILTGKLDGVKLEELISQVHVGVISNALWFQAPVKLFQYSAAQLAVISRNTPTIKELSQNRSCYSFFDTTLELEQQMIKFMKNPPLTTTLGREAKDFIETNFSEKNYNVFLNEIIESL